MAISRDKKEALVTELTNAINSSKMVVYAAYTGIDVEDMQALRRTAREQGVTIKVVKNRLVKVALAGVKDAKDIDTSLMKGQLLYAYSAEDEVIPAKILDEFAQTHPEVQLVGGFNATGASLNTADVTALAKLPTKNELIAQTVATLLSPLNDTVNALSGNLHGLLDGIRDHANA